ncbi:DEAD/DEAH box helicase [Chenggangzhangella methanolivorans]|uniref:DEAD-box ATP-dependent RNA helicase RhpA n=1 Tax=Chenggangzhangella methanolivorans TaxID=1437009 RepID=A0A9E6UMJ7_9HYPH|nr:DEAD/DEAH box helicase [Chenggangzhangella methanolivorans]QZO00091.1 DEAD/DEAH box helicase [Chenggangzhangella methanolivorans]
MSFSELGLSPKVLAAVEASGYTAPTPIQAAAIPHVLARRDVLGIAQTGTGKTASFTLPMLTRLESGRARARMPRTLILEPTRELAAQVEENFTRYGQNHKLNMALLIGGVSFGDQDAKLTRGVDVLIATPGRLLDHFERGRLLLTGIEILVIDEADRMLDMGFIPDIERICKLIPPARQTLFFSATMPPEIQRLTEQFLRDPERIEVARPNTSSANITQLLVRASDDASEKRDALRRALRSQENFKNAIVFCNRKRDIGVVHKSLEKHGFNVAALHGDMDQRARMAALDRFKTGDVELLVASDVAARGLDIPDVSHVVNYDVPIHAEDYVHRIGRTGRAGKNGVSLTLVAPSDGKNLGAIEQLTGSKIAWQGDALEEDEMAAAGGRRGRARSGRRSEQPAKAERPAKAAKPAVREEKPSEARPKSRRPDKVAEQAAPKSRDTAPAAPYARNGEPAPREANEGRVVGLGDHVPAFLLKPVRLKRA